MFEILFAYHFIHKSIIRKIAHQLRQEIVQVCRMLWQKGFEFTPD